MKNIVLAFSIIVATTSVINAQTKPVIKPVTTPVTILKTANTSVSYVMGEIPAYNFIQQG